MFAFLSTDEGRKKFWAEDSRTDGNEVRLSFSNGVEARCQVLKSVRPHLFSLSYFGSVAEFELADDGAGGTDLTLRNEGVGDVEWTEVHAGWLNVLLPLKAAIDFDIDLRNHDPARTWDQGFVDG